MFVRSTNERVNKTYQSNSFILHFTFERWVVISLHVSIILILLPIFVAVCCWIWFHNNRRICVALPLYFEATQWFQRQKKQKKEGILFWFVVRWMVLSVSLSLLLFAFVWETKKNDDSLAFCPTQPIMQICVHYAPSIASLTILLWPFHFEGQISQYLCLHNTTTDTVWIHSLAPVKQNLYHCSFFTRKDSWQSCFKFPSQKFICHKYLEVYKSPFATYDEVYLIHLVHLK